MAPPDDNIRRVTIRDDAEIARHVSEQSIVRMEKELDRLSDQLSEMLRRMPTDDEMRELRALLANRRAYAAATTALKNAALWIVAIAAAITVLQGGFVAAVKAAFGVTK